ncbi:unnamed protein product, partial [Ectocarpus sp. 8 AP-2014]
PRPAWPSRGSRARPCRPAPPGRSRRPWSSCASSACSFPRRRRCRPPSPGCRARRPCRRPRRPPPGGWKLSRQQGRRRPPPRPRPGCRSRKGSRRHPRRCPSSRDSPSLPPSRRRRRSRPATPAPSSPPNPLLLLLLLLLLQVLLPFPRPTQRRSWRRAAALSPSSLAWSHGGQSSTTSPRSHAANPFACSTVVG